MLSNKIIEMSLIENWHTEDIHQENLFLSVFSIGVRSKRIKILNRHKVLISRFV